MTSLAAGAIALNAPVATAAEPEGDCRMNSVQQDSATGQNYEGAAAGYAVDTDGDAVSVRCYITVNNSEVASTPVGNGTGFAVTGGPVSFQATPEDAVAVCVEINGELSHCNLSTHRQIPPQEVIDALNSVLEQIDPTICPIIAEAAGTYGPLFINEQGDIYVNNGGVWDCPPYDMT